MRILRQTLAVFLLLSIPSMATQGELPTCAVLTFDESGGGTSGEAGLLSNMISVNAARSGKYAVIPRYKVNQMLSQQRYRSGSYKSTTAAGLAAGRMLKADSVIFGTFSRNGDKNEASAFLMDVQSGRIIDQIQIAGTGDASSFRSKAAGEISRKLLGQDAQAAASSGFARIEAPPPAAPPVERAPAKPVTIATPPPTTPIQQPVKIVNPMQTAQPTYVTPPQQSATDRFYQNMSKFSASTEIYFGEFKKAAEGRLEAGMHYRSLSLKKDTDDSFLGTINTLDVESDGLPLELFATWHFNEFIGAEISWFNLRARTVTNPEGFSDGAICVSGPTFAITGKYEDYAPWVPFASLGIGLFSANFDHQAWWQNGYESVEAWESLGRPTERIKTRNMELSDTTGFFFMIGMRYKADEHWSLELAYRNMSLEVDDRYTISVPGELVRDYGVTTFPLDNSSILVGARYLF